MRGLDWSQFHVASRPQSIGHKKHSAAVGRNQVATKNTKSHKKAYRVEIFASLCVFCGDKDLRLMQIF
jgi:hypothetical protein